MLIVMLDALWTFPYSHSMDLNKNCDLESVYFHDRKSLRHHSLAFLNSKAVVQYHKGFS